MNTLLPKEGWYYRVHALILKDIAREWEAWMADHHIPAVMATGCFISARIQHVEKEDTATHELHLIEYLVPTRQDFDRYERRFAKELREEHTNRYADRVQTTRELTPVTAGEPE